MNQELSRREWLTLALGLAPSLWSWNQRPQKGKEKENMPADDFPVPLLAVKGGSYAEIGFQIGRHFRSRIQAAFSVRKEWIADLVAFMAADPQARREPFLSALRDELPHLLDELRGIGEGAEVPWPQMLAAFLNPELSTLMKLVPIKGGCTTVAVAAGDQLMLGHNEDGSCAYSDSMYLLEIAWPSGLKSWCFSYPGYLPGNGPSMNSAGLVQTVNYIGAARVRPGIPRYALDRAIMEAKTLDQALALATHPRRAYSQNHVLLSRAEKKIIGVEVSPDKFSVTEVSGVYVHANHFISPELKDVPQFESYKVSSLPRQTVADQWKNEVKDPAGLSPDDLLHLLQSHQNYPLSICRHPAPKITGCTLAAAIFADPGRVRFFANQPCQGIRRDFELG